MLGRGDRVKLKGRKPSGTIRSMDDDHWVCVNWDELGPKYVHEYELEAVDLSKEFDEAISAAAELSHIIKVF